MTTSRNIYRDEVDFAALALQDKDFNKHVKTNGQVNFGDPQAVKQLTISLLKRDFNISVTLPDDRLCPPVPNRLNYILWLQDILDQTSQGHEDVYDAKRDVTGFDVGTGSSAIYPLLGTSLRPRWRMLCSDIDPSNHANASSNIALNPHLSARIKLLPLRSPSLPLIPLDEFGLADIDFVMTNPPFYSSLAELRAAAKAKSREPLSACTGAEVEMVYGDGGEVGFVCRLVAESRTLGSRVRWYSAMLGKLDSVAMIVAAVKEAGCSNWCVGQFAQGNKTRRWAVAWSFGGHRPTVKIARGGGPGVDNSVRPFPSEIDFRSELSFEEAVVRVREKLQAMILKCTGRTEGDGTVTVIGSANGNVWSRAARRKKQKEIESGGVDEMEEDDRADQEAALVFKLQLRQLPSKETQVLIRWLVGQDHVLFESFCGMVKRQIMQILP